MRLGDTTLYGNEWITDGADYYKVKITKDGIYSINFQTLRQAGFQGTISGDKIRVYHNGTEIPIRVSNDGAWNDADYLVFRGYKTRSEIDAYLFPKGSADISNPAASLYSDTAVYYIYIDPQTNGARTAEVMNDTTSAPAPETNIIAEAIFSFDTKVMDMYDYLSSSAGDFALENSKFIPGKGLVNATANQTISFNLPGIDPNSSIPGRFSFKGTTNIGNYGINLGHDNQVKLNGQLIDTIYSNSAAQLFVNTTLSDNSHILKATNQLEFLPGHNKDLFYIGYIRANYPRSTDLTDKSPITFYVQNPNADTYLIFHQNSGSFSNPYLTDSLGKWQIKGIIIGNDVVFRVPGVLSGTKLTLTSDELITIVSTAEKRNLKSWQNWSPDFTIITSHKLLNSPGASVLDDYAAYRSSPDGGGHQSGIIAIEELYESFAYGQTYNPIAIKNFINFQHQKSTVQQFYLLIGKAFPYNEVRFAGGLQTAITNGFSLPTIGDLGSDNMLASEDYDHLNMVAAIGRLPYKTTDQLQLYLTKLKARDQAFKAGNTSEENAWMKKIIYVNGGQPGQSDQASINSFQRSTSNTISTNTFSAYTSFYQKSTTDPIGPIVDEFFANVNKGASIVDYFGHGSIIDLAIQLERPNQYANSAKFPFLIIRGCNAGNIHAVQECVSERVLTGTDFEDRGYIAVIGSAGKSTIGQLGVLGQNFYNLLGGDLYGKTMGQMMQQAFSNSNVNTSKEAFQQVYTGDPAISFTPLPGPDYRIDPASPKLNPAIVSTQDKEFSISFNIENLGSNTAIDSLDYAVYYQDAGGKTIDSLISKIYHPQTVNKLTVTFPLAQNAGGINKVYLKVDPFGKIAEQILPNAEANNEYRDAQGNLGFSFFVKTSQIKAIYPGIFSIVDSNKVNLYAFSSELDDAIYTYRWTLDTTDLFNSPSRYTQEIQSHSGHLVWSPDVALIENVAYYWKVERDSLSPEKPYNSAVSNFTYIPGGEGYLQHHNGQYRLNTNKFITADGPGNNLKFGKRDLSFIYTNGLTSPENINYLGGSRDNILQAGMQTNKYLNPHPGSGLIVIWYLKDSAFVYFPAGFEGYGSNKITDSRGFYFLYFNPQVRESRINLVNFIENIVGPEDAFFFATVNKKDSLDIDIQDWAQDSIFNNGRNIFNILEKYGATRARDVGTQGLPYSILIDKRYGVQKELLSNDYQEHTINYSFKTNANQGTTEQTFGPSKQWDKIEFLLGQPNVTADSVDIRIEGISQLVSGQNIVKIFRVRNKHELISFDISDIDAKSYPIIKVNMSFLDNANYRGKLDSLDYLKIYAKELPEATIVTSSSQINKDTFQRGEKLSLQVQSANIGRYDMDSMLVSYTLRYHTNEQWRETKRYGVLRRDASDFYTLDLDTRAFDGPAQLIVDLNPANDQAELTHINNVWARNLYIHNDNENPLLDVTYDGEHIFDGDIISSKPLIKINIRDENKYFALNDSSIFELILTYPNDSIAHINATNQAITFIPADPDKLNVKNQATIEYRPDFTQEGDYTLEVRAKDASGNLAGGYNYSRKFKIILKESVSKIFNYPNPFSTATRFVYTLTGDELPTYYKIQIMTVSGKIVREITQAELGPLKIGKHMTDYVWDGTDQFGDKLANGIYLYRLIMKNQSKTKYDEYELSDKSKTFFDGDWGKLVIIR
jgi:hypothetical protein